MKIAIVGSREFQRFDLVLAYVNQLQYDTIVISGGCRGVDLVTENAAIKRGLVVLHLGRAKAVLRALFATRLLLNFAINWLHFGMAQVKAPKTLLNKQSRPKSPLLCAKRKKILMSIDGRLSPYFFEWNPLKDEPEALFFESLLNSYGDILRAFSALGSTGLPERQRAYECICNPFANETQAEKLADSQWSCGQIGLAVLRFLGVDSALLDEKDLHLKGGPVAQLERLGRELGAWLPKSSKALLPPRFGQIVIIGTGQNVHVLCVVECKIRPNGGWVVTSVDGGQIEGAGRGCKTRVRVLTPEKTWLSADNHASPEHPSGGGRETYGAIDIAEIDAAKFGRARILPH